MDGDSFDDLTRRLAADGTTRRRFLRDLGGTVAGAVLIGLGVRSTGAKQDTSNPAASTCDGCNWVCSNCPIACCSAFGNSHFKPRHP
jgi:hypothetical protein